MSLAIPPVAHPASRDPITWRQIGVGYLILVCIGVGLALALLDPRSPATDPLRSMIAFAAFAGLYRAWKLVQPALTRASTRLGPTPDGQLRLKRMAIGAMWLLSLAICAVSIRVTQLVNPW